MLYSYFHEDDTFNNKFEILLKKGGFENLDILNYIKWCTKTVLQRAQKTYPDKELLFINPVVSIKQRIFPSDHVTTDPNMLKALSGFLKLADTKVIVPISSIVKQEKLPGITLLYNIDFDEVKHTAYKKVDLNCIKTNIAFDDDEINEQYLISKIERLDINLNKSSQHFHNLCDELNIKDKHEMVKLKKSLIYFRNISPFFGDTLAYSFVNKFNKIHSFFDCTFTLISRKSFSQDELRDFAIVLENLSAPVGGYLNKGIAVTPSILDLLNSLNKRTN